MRTETIAVGNYNSYDTKKFGCLVINTYICHMNELYEEALAHFKTERILFRGFLIEKVKSTIRILDIRTPYYKPIEPPDLEVLLAKGFRVGTTYLLMKSDEGKIERFNVLANEKLVKSEETDSPRKKEEYRKAISRYNKEVEYYESQVRRWQNFIKYNSK